MLGAGIFGVALSYFVPENDSDRVEFSVSPTKEEQLRSLYGDEFVNHVGLGRLERMQEVEVEAVGLSEVPEHGQVVDSRSWEGIDLARGEDGRGRPFIAIRVQQIFTNAISTKELIVTIYGQKEDDFLRYYANTSGFDTNGHAVTAHLCHGYFRDEGWDKLQRLLNGENISEGSGSESSLVLKQTDSL